MTEGEAYDKGIRKDQYTGSYGDFWNQNTLKVTENVILTTLSFMKNKILMILCTSKQQKPRELVYHPTQKPIELGRYLIRTYTNPGDIVLDNACGSGSFLLS